MKARLTPEAERDLDEAVAWYDRQRPGLGDQFVRAIAACVGRIEDHPRMSPLVHGTTRRALVDVFPYQILYKAGQRAIVIHGVFHCARDPRRWKRRAR